MTLDGAVCVPRTTRFLASRLSGMHHDSAGMIDETGEATARFLRAAAKGEVDPRAAQRKAAAEAKKKAAEPPQQEVGVGSSHLCSVALAPSLHCRPPGGAKRGGRQARKRPEPVVSHFCCVPRLFLSMH